MLNLLRDPAWNGIAGIAAIIALIVAVWQEKQIAKVLPKIMIVIGRAIIGIVVLSFGPPIQWFFEGLFEGGMPLVIRHWQSVAILYSWNAFAIACLAYAVFPGTATAAVASPKNEKAILRTSIVAIITLTVTDIIIIIVNNWGANLLLGDTPFLTAFFANVVGGFIAGTIIVYLVDVYDKALNVSSLNRSA